MMKECYRIEGRDVRISEDISLRAALSDEFIGANRMYFDNDQVMFEEAHPNALNKALCKKLVDVLKQENRLRKRPL